MEGIDFSTRDIPHASSMWSAPVTPITKRVRPSTIHESSFDFQFSDHYQVMPLWPSSTGPFSMVPSVHEQFESHNYPTQTDTFPTAGDQDWWSARTYGGFSEPLNIEAKVPIGQAFTADEAIPMVDVALQPSAGLQTCYTDLDHLYDHKRMSGSSFTLSTSGGISDLPPYDDIGSALSDVPSDFPLRSNRNSLMSSTPLSPVASPRMTPQHRTELMRTQSRGRASPSPRPSMRSAPYTIEGRSSKRWSTGSYAPSFGRRPSPFVYRQSSDAPSVVPGTEGAAHVSPPMTHTSNALHLPDFQCALPPSNHLSNRNSLVLPSSVVQEPAMLEAPPPLLSHGFFRMLSSNSESQALHSQCVDHSDPPDLFAALEHAPSEPPAEDMLPDDADLTPHEQELRFEGDLYTPKWVRGHGNKREGWCGICKPGRWLVLKNSAFWYDKSFTHGISAATGHAFQEPLETRRVDGNPDVWEGICGSCNDWVPLVSSKKKGTTWFRHAYKCHTHPKIKDAPKRRRETTATRASSGTSTATISGARTPVSRAEACGSSSKSSIAGTPTFPPETPTL